MDNLENPTYDEAPMAALAAEELEGKSREELQAMLQKLREIRQVPQKRRAATSGKKAKIQDEIAHLL